MNYFQEFLVTIHSHVLHKLRNPIIQLGFTQTFACIECRSLDVIRAAAKDEHPRCSGCGGNTGASKETSKWKQGGKGKEKQTRI